MHIYGIQCDWQSDVIDVKEESDEIDEKDASDGIDEKDERGSDAAPTLRSEKLSHGDDEALRPYCRCCSWSDCKCGKCFSQIIIQEHIIDKTIDINIHIQTKGQEISQA